MEIVDVPEDLNRELKSDFRGMKDGFVQVGERKWFYPKKYKEVAEEFKNFEVRPDDIWIMGYPRSGTTLTEDLVWLLSHNLDFEAAKEPDLNEGVKFFELNMILTEKTIQEIEEKFPQEAQAFQDNRNTLKILNRYKTRRVIKTHLPFELLPPDILNKGCKVIYICRFPKDVCVSHYNLQSSNRKTDFCAGFEKFWEYFKNGHIIFGPYFEHVKQGFERTGSENFMFTFYEEFSKDNRAHIQKLSQFLEIPITEDELKKLEEFIQIDNFREIRNNMIKDKNNEPINFIRKGKVGGWRDYFNRKTNDEADAWIEQNTKMIGFKYPQPELLYEQYA